MSVRSRCGLFFVGVVLVVGCDNKASSPGTAGGGKPDGYAAKLAGTWEEVADAGGKKGDDSTIEFKADGTVKFVMGPFDMAGTYKVAKEDGKSVTIDTEMPSPFEKEPAKAEKQKKTFSITFDDADSFTMTPTDKPDPKKFKRKK